MRQILLVPEVYQKMLYVSIMFSGVKFASKEGEDVKVTSGEPN
jgi:hypothetical protein